VVTAILRQLVGNRRERTAFPGCTILLQLAWAAWLCVAVLSVASSPAEAAQGRAPRGPHALWSTFPLNPTNEQIATVRVSPFPAAPSATPAVASHPGSGTDGLLPTLAYAGGAGLLALLVLGGLVALRDQHRRAPRRPFVSSQVVVGFGRPGYAPRFLPDIEADVRRRRGRTRLVIAPRRPRLGVSALPGIWALRRRLWRLQARSRDLRRRLSRMPSSRGIVRRLRYLSRNEDVRGALVGVAIAVVLAYVILRAIG